MKPGLVKVILGMMLLCVGPFIELQQCVATNASARVPALVRYSGTLTDLNGKPLDGTIGVTVLLYKDERGGAPLWMKTQNVTPDKSGH